MAPAIPLPLPRSESQGTLQQLLPCCALQQLPVLTSRLVPENFPLDYAQRVQSDGNCSENHWCQQCISTQQPSLQVAAHLKEITRDRQMSGVSPQPEASKRFTFFKRQERRNQVKTCQICMLRIGVGGWDWKGLEVFLNGVVSPEHTAPNITLDLNACTQHMPENASHSPCMPAFGVTVGSGEMGLSPVFLLRSPSGSVMQLLLRNLQANKRPLPC